MRLCREARPGYSSAMSDDLGPDPELERLLDDAWEALEDGDLRAVKRSLRAARESAGDDPAVIELEAALAREQDEPERALDAYRRWSEADPDDPEPWLGSAEVYLDFGEPGAGSDQFMCWVCFPGYGWLPMSNPDGTPILGTAALPNGSIQVHVGAPDFLPDL